MVAALALLALVLGILKVGSLGLAPRGNLTGGTAVGAFAELDLFEEDPEELPPSVSSSFGRAYTSLGTYALEVAQFRTGTSP